MITIAIDEVRETVIEMLDELAATTPAPPAGGDVAGGEAGTVAISIDIIGPFTTVLQLRIGAGDAARLTAAMLGESIEHIEPMDAQETMAELANVVGGGVKGLVDDETHLGIPRSSRVDEPLGALALGTVIEHELGRFEVALAESDG